MTQNEAVAYEYIKENKGLYLKAALSSRKLSEAYTKAKSPKSVVIVSKVLKNCFPDLYAEIRVIMSANAGKAFIRAELTIEEMFDIQYMIKQGKDNRYIIDRVPNVSKVCISKYIKRMRERVPIPFTDAWEQKEFIREVKLYEE